jgi:hypothetical protein
MELSEACKTSRSRTIISEDTHDTDSYLSRPTLRLTDCALVSFTSGSRATTPRPRQELPLERGGPPNEVLYYWRDATYERI